MDPPLVPDLGPLWHMDPDLPLLSFWAGSLTEPALFMYYLDPWLFLLWLHESNLSTNVFKFTTGCLAVTVLFETPLFSDICRRSRLSFHVVIGHCGGFDILKKKFEIFFGSGSGPGTSPAWFSGSAMGIQLFGLKTTSHGKSDLLFRKVNKK